MKLAQVFSDIDFSGFRGAKPRPALEELKASRLEFAAVIVPKLSRFGRSMKDLVALFDLFDRDGIALVFLDMSIDTSTSQGRLLRHVMAAFAEYESDVKSDYTRATQRMLAREGRPHGPMAPYGYRVVGNKAERTYVIDEETAAVVKELFHGYLTGGSLNTMARELNEKGVRLSKGGKWSRQRVKLLLDNPAYAAFRIYNGEEFESRWPAIVSRAVYDEVKARRHAARSTYVNGSGRPSYLLSRLIELSLRPATVRQIEHTLREFCCLVAERDPDVRTASDFKREHVEAYKSWLADRISTKTGKALTRNTVGKRLGLLANFFERATEWGWDDVPARIPVFASDKPIPDERLPRFVDDAAATKLLIATRSDPDLFTRVVVEVLARTGLRIGELLDLTVDAAVQIGSAYWLRVPLGKLHNDRYIPLHPQLKDLLDEWVAQRPSDLRSPYLFVDNGRWIPQPRVRLALTKVAARAGIGHVTPHQLRHTLATQAVNRGMSLEALAALLGHKTLSMTLVYARIADRTVADEYFAVSEKVDELYEKAGALPAEAEGTKMSKLRNEMDRRMLGNGYCARPVGMDCHFESICESCAFFVTTIDFKPTLERQRDDAEGKGQVGRQRIFEGLLRRLEQDAS